MFSDILLTVDFDRTMTDPQSRIPQVNLEAVRYFMDNGGTFTVNTGRSIPMSVRFLDLVPMNAPLLAYNGAAWYDVKTGTLSNVREIPLNMQEVIRDVQEKFPGLLLEVQGVDAHYAFRKDKNWQAYCDANQGAWAYGQGKDPGPFLKFALAIFEDDRVSSVYRQVPEEQALFQAANDYILKKYGHVVDTTFACARILDVQAKGVSKCRSAMELKQVLGKKILICVGDAENDASMLDGADFAFCPADGVVADRYENVCKCGNGAVAEVIYKKIPEILQIQP